MTKGSSLTCNFNPRAEVSFKKKKYEKTLWEHELDKGEKKKNKNNIYMTTVFSLATYQSVALGNDINIGNQWTNLLPCIDLQHHLTKQY